MSLRRATTTVVCLGAVAATFLGAQAAASPPRVGHPRASNAAAVKVPKLTGWSQLSSRGVPSISVPGIVQDGAGAQVVWRQDDTSLTESLRTRKVSGAGRVTTALGTIVSGWSSLNDDPDLVDLPSGRLAVFAGMRSTSPSEKYDGAMYFSTSTNHGGTWSLGNGSLSETTSAGSYGSSVINDGGEPLVATIASSSSYITLHRGISPIPATSGDWTTSKSPLCCAYSVSLGQDSASGNVWALWNSNSNKSSQRGVIAAKVYPTPVTNQQQAPSSLTKGNFDPEVVQPVPAASRRGGGVWTAYKVGYPTANRIRLWKVGTKQGFFIKAPDASMVTLAPGLNGRMWVAWWQNSKSRVHVARTNPAVTRIGPVRSIKPPTKKGLSTSIYSMAAVGMGGGLHLAINAAPGFGSSQIWYQKIAPALLVSATPARINAGKVTVRVSDAGQPIAGARVRFLGAAKLTNKKGVAVFRVKPSVHGGNYLVTGAKNGYAKGSDRVRVT